MTSVWPDEAWLSEYRLQVVTPEQVVQLPLSGGVHVVSAATPRWMLEATTHPWSGNLLSAFMNGLVGATETVRFPLSEPVPADGSWVVRGSSLTPLTCRVRISERSQIANPAVGQYVRVGDSSEDDDNRRLYQVVAVSGNDLDLAPRRLPPEGTDSLVPGDRVSVRLADPVNAVWGRRVVGEKPLYLGTTLLFVEV